MRHAFMALLATLLFSCAPVPRAPAHSAQALATCEANGGTVAVVGLSVIPSCLLPYPDGDRFCSDSTQCHGRCLAREPAPVGPGRTASGQCEAFHPTGFEECAREVRGGRVAPGCADPKEPS